MESSRVTDAAAPADLDAYREQADRFIAELDEQYYRNYAGLSEKLDLEPIYERNAELTRLERVQAIGRATDGDPRVRELWRFACESHLGEVTREQAEQVARLASRHGTLARRHRPSRFDGPVTFVAAAERPPVLSPDLWRPYVAGPIDVHELPCTHLELTDPGPIAAIGSLIEVAA
jgi:thioesterase domain-containing protein